MGRDPSTVAYVADLARSRAFYRDTLGLSVQDISDDMAIVEPDGWPLLLAGSLAGKHSTIAPVKPGGTIHRFSSDINSLARRIRDGGGEPTLHETDWGDRTLTVTDPDGYVVSFWTAPERSIEQTIALYASGPGALERAIAGLSDEALSWKPTADDWSVREIVHHIADSDATALFRVKMALAEPGRVMFGNPYQPDTWASSLVYNQRDIAPAMFLLRATRQHILQLLDHLPDAMTRTVSNPEGEHTTVETFISMLSSHLMIHIEQIRDVLQSAGIEATNTEDG
jgi:catechol 2,3-dioxygenase-like lactoylglutathione lyase family enzyme